MTITASAQKATATIAASRFITEQKMLEAVQGAIDTETAPLLTEIAGLKQEINTLQAAAEQQQVKLNNALSAAKMAKQPAVAAVPSPAVEPAAPEVPATAAPATAATNG